MEKMPISHSDSPSNAEAVSSTNSCCVYPYRVLVVEDTNINQLILQELLSALNVSTTIVSSGEEALTLFNEEDTKPPFSLVLMDLQMPGLSGIQTARILREKWRKNQLIIIAMTAREEAEVCPSCFEAGMNDYISKPFTTEILYTKLTQWLRDLVTPSHASKSSTHWQLFSDEQCHHINTKIALNRLENDIDLYTKLLEQFVKNYSKSSSHFHNAIDCQDFATAERIIHTLKGLAGSIGATRLAVLSEDFEEILFQKNIPSITATATIYFSELESVLADIAELLQDKNAAKETEHHSIQLTQELITESKQCIKKLHSLLNDYDSESVDFFLQNNVLLSNTLPPGTFQKLSTAIECYQFDEALLILAAIE